MNDLQLLALLTAVFVSKRELKPDMNLNTEVGIAEQIMKEVILRQNRHAVKHREAPAEGCFHCEITEELQAMKSRVVGIDKRIVGPGQA